MVQKTKFLLVIFLLHFLSSCSSGPEVKEAARPPFGTEEDIAFAQKLWAALLKNRFLGANAIETSQQRITPIPDSPHQQWIRTLRFELELNRHRGHFFMAKNYAPPKLSQEEEVAQRREKKKRKAQEKSQRIDKYADVRAAKSLTSITVMFRREPGYDPDHQDWFWAQFAPNGQLQTNPQGRALAGRVAKGKSVSCIACHQGAPNRDYTYSMKAIK